MKTGGFELHSLFFCRHSVSRNIFLLVELANICRDFAFRCFIIDFFRRNRDRIGFLASDRRILDLHCFASVRISIVIRWAFYRRDGVPGFGNGWNHYFLKSRQRIAILNDWVGCHLNRFSGSGVLAQAANTVSGRMANTILVRMLIMCCLSNAVILYCLRFPHYLYQNTAKFRLPVAYRRGRTYFK